MLTTKHEKFRRKIPENSPEFRKKYRKFLGEKRADDRRF